MKKTLKILLLVVIAVVGYIGFLFVSLGGILPVHVVKNARTLYEGQVGIEQIPLAEIQTKLKEKNIQYTVDTEGASIVVYPHGPGFGPVSFVLTGNLLKTTKDITGTPDPKKFKQEVRQDMKDVGGILTIREDSWKITKMTYPWTVVY